MPAVKDYQPITAQDLASIIKYSIPLFEAKKPNSQNKDKLDISDRVNSNLVPLPPQNVPVNSLNYGPLVPYQVSDGSYGVMGAYLDRRIEAMHDFTDRVPGKHLHTFPSSGNQGLFGFTYLGDQRIWRRDDLIGSEFAKMVDVHESIHTPDEYETRRITEWMMEKEKPGYIK